MTDITRRNFLKASLICAVGATLPFNVAYTLDDKAIELNNKDFNYDAEYGNAFQMTRHIYEMKDKNDIKLILQILNDDASTCLPRGLIYEIRTIPPRPLNYDAIAWYWHKGLNHKKATGFLKEPEFIPYTGCFRCGTFMSQGNKYHL